MNHLITLEERKHTDQLLDLFCGGGGSGGGLLDANKLLGRKVQGTFVNHWDRAIEVHEANHPEHRHLKEDLFLLDPTTIFPADTTCSLLWASPSCRFFSVARGAACVNEQDRSHATTIIDWVKHLNPEAILVENVPEFRDWTATVQKRDDRGVLIWALNAKPVKKLPRGLGRQPRETEAKWGERMLDAGYTRYEVPDKTRKGEYFQQWLEDMKAMGYDADYRILGSADYGDPTIRKRLFVYFVRRDSGKRIVWPAPYAGDPKKAHGRPMNWRTARDIIQWDLQGDSVFTRKKDLAANTFRRLAIGLVKYGLKDFLVSSAHSSKSAAECETRVKPLDEPIKTLTQKGDRGLVSPQAYIIPKDAGHKCDWVKDVDSPVSALTTSHSGEGLAVPMVDHVRGTGVAGHVDSPVHAPTAGGQHQALAEAFMFAIDQSGGQNKNDGTYSKDEPVRTLVTKHNQACINVELQELSGKFLEQCEARGVDTSRAETFLGFLVEELHKRGRVDAKPYIYVYYSNGSEGKAIDEPLPACRTKAGHALVYPVIELDGTMLRIDLLYRMLTPLELQRAMGFPDDMVWPKNLTKTEVIKAIGNAVSRGVARALGLAWYDQDPDVWKHVKHIYE